MTQKMALDSRTGEEEEILDQRVTDGVASGQDHPPLHQPERISHREEPDAGNLRVRICGGRGGQRPRLPGGG